MRPCPRSSSSSTPYLGRSWLADGLGPLLGLGVTVARGPALWRAKGENGIFPGLCASGPSRRDGTAIYRLDKAAGNAAEKLYKEQKFHSSGRFSEARSFTGGRAGIGRPSTYAASSLP
jgi:DNA topoisomerase-1